MNGPAGLGPPVHLGFAVADLERAQQHFTDLLGTRWEEVDEIDAPFVADGQDVRWKIRVARSRAGDPPLELLEGAPGSTWHTDRTAVLHHYAYTADDLWAARAALVDQGWSLALRNRTDTPESFAYLTRPGHVRVEVCRPHAPGVRS